MRSNIILTKIIKPNGHYDNNKLLPLISKTKIEEYCNSCWPNDENNVIEGFIWTQYLTKKDYKLYAKDSGNSTLRHEIKKQIISLLKGVRLKTLEERVEELENALKSVVKNFPVEVLKDQMNEDYDLITIAIKKEIII